MYALEDITSDGRSHYGCEDVGELVECMFEDQWSKEPQHLIKLLGGENKKFTNVLKYLQANNTSLIYF